MNIGYIGLGKLGLPCAVAVTVRYNVIDTDEQRKVKMGLDDKWELGWHLVVKAKK